MLRGYIPFDGVSLAMYDRILVPTDGSPSAAAATDYGLDVARTFDATVYGLAVAEPLDAPGVAADETEQATRNRAKQASDRLRQRAADWDVEPTVAVREGVPYRTILDYAAAVEADLVVMGARGTAGGRSDRLGTTTERVITLADVPVLTVEAAAEPSVSAAPRRWPYGNVVVATDGSDAAERAGEHGLNIAERYGANVHVVYVVDTDVYGYQDAPRSIVGLLTEGGHNATHAIVEQATDRNLAAQGDVLRGDPVEEVLAYTGGVGAGLLVVGTRGRSASGDYLLGSTTAELVRRTSVPVLLVG